MSFRRTALWVLLVLSLSGVLGACASGSGSNSAAAAAGAGAPRFAADRWEADIAAFEAIDREHPPAYGGVVFYGGSSIRMWGSLAQDFAGVNVLNRGFGGCEMEDLARYAARAVVPCAPQRVAVYAGDNDLFAGKSPERVLADFQALVQALHAALPRARIGFISIKPSPSRWQLAPAIREANQRVRSYVSSDTLLSYVDVFTPMLGHDGQPRAELFLPDMLHLNAQGYALWTQALTPFVRAEAASASIPAVPRRSWMISRSARSGGSGTWPTRARC